jgi:hypothetical protein
MNNDKNQHGLRMTQAENARRKWWCLWLLWFRKRRGRGYYVACNTLATGDRQVGERSVSLLTFFSSVLLTVYQRLVDMDRLFERDVLVLPVSISYDMTGPVYLRGDVEMQR